MKNKEKIVVSVIIVNYRVKIELFQCLTSILNSKTETAYEIIVIDNDEDKTIEKELKKTFQNIVYIKSPGNIGFGAANNIGAQHAKGNFLFFLNPDSLVFENTIDVLISFLQNNKKAGIAAPLLLDKNKKTYPLQGSMELTPLRGIFSLSFINKFFPNNVLSKEYWLSGWNKKTTKEVDTVPGTAFMISKELFFKAGKFDKRFFLFFEEHDLCRRVRQYGYKLYILPKAKVIHYWGVSTRQRNDIDTIFNTSRFLYFRKHYGFLPALLIHIFLTLNKTTLILGSILGIAAFLRFFLLSSLMPFIGDFGWFYLSARDLLLGKEFPLVGITSSHTWLHQGPLWTYILSIALWFTNFNPVSGAYVTALTGIVSVLLIYFIGSLYFSKRVGLIAASLYATSPLVIFHSRLPYHTSPIPFFVLLLLWATYKWVKGNEKMFPWIIILLSFLYNFELATFVLVFVILFIFSYGLWRRKTWATMILKKRILAWCLIGFLVVMFPILLYDVSHKLMQTVGFVLWIPYRIIKSIIAVFNGSFSSEHSLISMFSFLFVNIQRLVFFLNPFFSLFLILMSIVVYVIKAYKTFKKGIILIGEVLLLLFIVIPFLGFIFNKTPSDAYLPMFFPIVMLMIAYFFDFLMYNKYMTVFTVITILIISTVNSYTLVQQNYLTGLAFRDRVDIAKQITSQARGRAYNLSGKGEGSEFASFTMNYEYLTWWLGHGPSNYKENLQFIIQEKNDKIYIEKK